MVNVNDNLKNKFVLKKTSKNKNKCPILVSYPASLPTFNASIETSLKSGLKLGYFWEIFYASTTIKQLILIKKASICLF